jgi:putative tryptophan/tyrosine transport system substrate-binding protein
VLQCFEVARRQPPEFPDRHWFKDMRRRELLLAGASLALSSMARAQSGAAKPPLIAYLTAGAKVPRVPFLAAFSKGLKQLGLTEGRSYFLETRFAEGDFNRIPVLARELLGLDPDVFLVSTTPANLVAKQVITTKPIVMVAVADPIGVGLVDSFARPGGNITGITNLTAELAGKRLEIVRDLLPGVSKVAIFVNLNDPGAAFQMRSVSAVADQLGIELQPVVDIGSVNDLEPAFDSAKRAGVAAAMRMVDPLEAALRGRTLALAAKYQLPTIYAFREAVESGGMISYGASQPDLYRQAAALIVKILNGAKPADLPVERPVKFELVINAKTAKALGIAIRKTLLVSADIIE